MYQKDLSDTPIDGLWNKGVGNTTYPTHVELHKQPQTKITKESWTQPKTGMTSLDETPTQELRRRKEKYMGQIRLI